MCHLPRSLGYQEVPRRIESSSAWSGKLHFDRRQVLSVVTGGTLTRKSRDDSGRRDLTNSLMDIRKVHVSGNINGHAYRLPDTRASMAAPRSPVNPPNPVPTTVVIVPLGAILLILRLPESQM
jgi:hypothetical protein